MQNIASPPLALPSFFEKLNPRFWLAVDCAPHYPRQIDSWTSDIYPKSCTSR